MNQNPPQDNHGLNGESWTGVDLDGTLAVYYGWAGPEHIGEPIPLMVNRVRQWLSEGKRVKIVTARVDPAFPGDAAIARRHIAAWLIKHLGQLLPITHAKDRYMFSLWDDRAVQVEANTGETLSSQLVVARARIALLECLLKGEVE